MKALNKTITLHPHTVNVQKNRSFCGGGSSLGEKVTRGPTLFAQQMKGESGFLGLLYLLAKKLFNNMFHFPRVLL